MTTWTDDEVGGSVWSEDEAAGTALGAATGSSLVGFVQSGSGATAETVQGALRRMAFSGQYSTAANFNTAQAALTDTAGFAGIRSSGTAKIGRGTALGQPSGTPTAATNGVGVLNGTYKYAYLESDGTGTTVLSASVTISPSNNTVRVTVPLPRRGTSQRYIYRTVAGGSDFFLLGTFGGGNGYFQTQWDDNAADNTLGAAAPSSDTSLLFALELNNSVKYFRTHPDQTTGAADITVLTGNSSEAAGAFALDVYGSYYGRTYLGNTVSSEKTGTSGAHFEALWQDITYTGNSPTSVLKIMPKGSLTLTPQTLSDPGLGDGMGSALSITATCPTTPTALVAGNLIQLTGAGSQSFSQSALVITMAAGYTGSSATYGQRAGNVSAHSGTAIGVQGGATAAAALNVGINGITTGGTKNIGVFGTSAGVDLAATALTFPSGITGIAGAFSNGANSDDILVCFDNTTDVFRVTNSGGFVAAGLNANSSTTFDFSTSGKGIFRILANGNTNIEIGSTNNVPLLLKTNGTTALTLSTAQAATFAGIVAVGGAAVSTTTALNLPASTTGVSSVRLAHGAAPSSPVDGDMWTTTAGLFVRINGSTVGPLS